MHTQQHATGDHSSRSIPGWRPHRRACRLAAAYFLLGAVLSLVMALGGALLGMPDISKQERFRIPADDEQWWEYFSARSWIADAVIMNWESARWDEVIAIPGEPSPAPVYVRLPAERDPRLPEWFVLDDRERSADAGRYWALAAGWPWRVLAEHWWDIDESRVLMISKPRMHSYLMMNPSGGLFNGVQPYPRIIPTEPLWVPLLMSSALYGAALFAAVCGSTRARAWLRTHRGRCEACNYDIRACAGAVCPECGSPFGAQQ